MGGVIKRLSYARNMASPKGSLDLQHLLTAKQNIEVRFIKHKFCGFRFEKHSLPALKSIEQSKITVCSKVVC